MNRSTNAITLVFAPGNRPSDWKDAVDSPCVDSTFVMRGQARYLLSTRTSILRLSPPGELHGGQSRRGYPCRRSPRPCPL